MKIAVLIAVFNRVAVTLAGLDAFFAAVAQHGGTEFEVFLVDDASPDGTAAAVRERFPQVHVFDGTGSLWWNGGMCVAYRKALEAPIEFDGYLMFNDDVVLYRNAIEDLIAAYVSLNRTGQAAVTAPMCTTRGAPSFVGKSKDPLHNPVRHPFAPELLMNVLPDGTLQRVDTFHGNCVLIPATVMHTVGGPDPRFTQMYADTDLGLAIGKRGCANYLMPAFLGICEPNERPPQARTFMGRIGQKLRAPHPIWEELLMVFKTYPLHHAIGNAAIRVGLWIRGALMAPDGFTPHLRRLYPLQILQRYFRPDRPVR